jgi:hypothetical protein
VLVGLSEKMEEKEEKKSEGAVRARIYFEQLTMMHTVRAQGQKKRAAEPRKLCFFFCSITVRSRLRWLRVLTEE